MGRSRKANPDHVLDADRGSGSVGTKVAKPVGLEEAEARGQDRAGLRELDAMTEGMSGLTRMAKDRERLTPRANTAELGHPRMRRQLPAPDQVRLPFSARQKNERSKDRVSTQAGMPKVQFQAQKQLVTDPGQWRTVNDRLSQEVGDVQALPEKDQEQVRRVDRAIRAYERRNDRGHVVYTNVQMPDHINHSNAQAYLDGIYEPGQVVEFDRYTAATHQLHETSGYLVDRSGRVVVMEMETRRGAYLGQSDKKDNTGHLLPRGMRFEYVGVHEATYQAPDGTTGTRVVVQLRDVTPTDDDA